MVQTTLTDRPRVIAVGPGFPWTSGGGAPLRFLAILSALNRLSACTYVGISPGANPPPVVPESLSSLTLAGVNARRLSTSRWKTRSWRVLAELGVHRPKPRRACVEEPLDVVLHQGGYDAVWFMTDQTWVTHEFVEESTKLLKVPTVVDLTDWPDEPTGEPQPRLRNLIVPARTADTWSSLNKVRARRIEGVRAQRLIGMIDAAVVSTIPPRAPTGLRKVVNAYPARPFTGPRDACTSVPTLLFQGNFLYPPNLDAAQHLVDEIVPALRRVMCRRFNIRLVGRGGERLMSGRSLPEEVSVVGYVDRIEDELDRADICVVPLRSGTGTRLKILEAWSHQIPVVSTAIGAAGLGAVAGTHLLIADSPQDFATACRRAVDDAALRRHLTTMGHQLLVERFDLDTVEAQVQAVLAAVLSAKGNGPKV